MTELDFDELQDTIELMKSNQYDDQMKAEYRQTYIRYRSLEKQVAPLKNADSEDETLLKGIALLEYQLEHMAEYLKTLKVRAMLAGIELNET